MTSIFSAIFGRSLTSYSTSPGIFEERERKTDSFLSPILHVLSLSKSSESINRQIYTFKMEIVLGMLVSSNFFFFFFQSLTLNSKV